MAPAKDNSPVIKKEIIKVSKVPVIRQEIAFAMLL